MAIKATSRSPDAYFGVGSFFGAVSSTPTRSLHELTRPSAGPWMCSSPSGCNAGILTYKCEQGPDSLAKADARRNSHGDTVHNSTRLHRDSTRPQVGGRRAHLRHVPGRSVAPDLCRGYACRRTAGPLERHRLLLSDGRLPGGGVRRFPALSDNRFQRDVSPHTVRQDHRLRQQCCQ